MFEPFANRSGCHGLQPEPLNLLFDLRVTDDVAENQFACAARVAGVDQCVHVRVFDQLEQQFKPPLIFLDGLQVEMRWNYR